ncbi:MAG: 3-deoxy-7-phosphoheptulonate synthase [Candidatus Gracilibacteria bacterium]|nr:3-deoxy-7-phosphoheptulonate synthase [Candidatus Gracilibacteria bacterium]
MTAASSNYKLASRKEHPADLVLDLGDGLKVGGKEHVVIAGPCAVEDEASLRELAQILSEAGIKILRGGAFKPRTSPYSFQGLGEEGLKILRRVADEFEMRVITEVIDISKLELVEKYADILQIGSRNMQNFELLKAVGKSSKPVLLKRSVSATLDEFLSSAEYILLAGNQQVMLCERGIRTFEQSARNTLDINAIPLLKKMTYLPVFVDPSHATGDASLVPAVSKASLAAGADGLMIEVHAHPEKAKSDGEQSMLPEDFLKLKEELEKVNKGILENQRNLGFNKSELIDNIRVLLYSLRLTNL